MLAEHLQQAAAETSTSDSFDRVVGVGTVPAGQEKVPQEVRRKAVRPSQGGSGRVFRGMRFGGTRRAEHFSRQIFGPGVANYR